MPTVRWLWCEFGCHLFDSDHVVSVMYMLLSLAVFVSFLNLLMFLSSVSSRYKDERQKRKKESYGTMTENVGAPGHIR